MTTLSLLLSIYASIISTILMVRWIRLEVVRWKVRKQLTKERLDTSHSQNGTVMIPSPSPTFLSLTDGKEEEGGVTSALELEVEFERSEVDEPSVEEREWEEEQRTLRKMGVKGV